MNWAGGEIPEGWKLRTLGEVAKVVGGGTPKTGVPGNLDERNGHPWITPADLTGYTEKYISRGRRNITDQGLASSAARIMPAGSVLFSSRAPIGYVAIASNPMATNQGFRSLVPGSEIDSEFLYHAMRYLRPLAAQMARGTTFPEISGTSLAKLPIAYPELPEQRAIAQSLDKAVTQVRAASNDLATVSRAIKKFRQAVLFTACSGKLTADWRSSHVADISDLDRRLTEAWREAKGHKKNAAPITEEDLPDIPETWRWMSIDSLASKVVDGVHKTPEYVEHGVPFVTVRNLTAGPGISFDSCKYIRESDHELYTSRTKPQRGDILISKDGTLGVTRAIRTDQEFSIFVSVAMIKPLLYDMTDYLEIALSSPQMQRQMIGVGSGLVHLVLRDLKADGVPVPPLEEQREIVRLVNLLLAKADEIQHQVETAASRLKHSSQAILAKAFRGDLIASLA